MVNNLQVAAENNGPNYKFVLQVTAKRGLTLPILRLLSYKHKDAKISEKHLNPVMLVFIV